MSVGVGNRLAISNFEPWCPCLAIYDGDWASDETEPACRDLHGGINGSSDVRAHASSKMMLTQLRTSICARASTRECSSEAASSSFLFFFLLQSLGDSIHQRGSSLHLLPDEQMDLDFDQSRLCKVRYTAEARSQRESRPFMA